MNRWLCWLLSALLAACTAAVPQGASFRDARAPIWSAAAFDPGQIAGTWRQVGGFAARAGGCRAGALRFQPGSGGLVVAGRLCLNGRDEVIRAIARPTGPGRFMVGDEEWWVLWVDAGYRTLAIGTPSGRFGVVLDRGAIAPDRLQAAREVFDFNGYRGGVLVPL